MTPTPRDSAAWRSWVPGERVVVRFRLADGGFSDALGELASVDESGVEVVTRRGHVRIPAGDIVLAKRVPPPPPPRHRC